MSLPVEVYIWAVKVGFTKRTYGWLSPGGELLTDKEVIALYNSSQK